MRRSREEIQLRTSENVVEHNRAGRRSATTIACADNGDTVTLLEHALLGYLGVTVFAFSISGGILLFMTSLPMLFGHRPALQSPERDEQASIGEDVAVFPLAIPLLSGPGTITTILLLANQARANTSRIWILALVSAAVYLISWCLLYASERLIARLGEGKVRILTRVLGIVLAAVAVQYVLNGVGGYYQSLLNGQ